MSRPGDSQALGKRWKLWHECLLGSDPNSVINQLYSLVWNAAAYRTINEARKLSPPAPEGGVALNGLMHNLLDHCFWDSQVIAVRRLVEANFPLSKDEDKNKSVFSLGALLKDMRANADLLTRANIFAMQGLDYDAEDTARKEDALCRRMFDSGEQYVCIPRECDPDQVVRLHARVDKLANANHSVRSPDDKVDPAIFDRLKKRMKSASDDIVTFATKYRAHAATPASRESAQAQDVSVSLKKLGAAHECLCRIHQFLTVQFFDTEQHSYLARPNYDPLKYADRPLVTPEITEQVRKFWDGQHSQAENCRPWTIAELLSRDKS